MFELSPSDIWSRSKDHMFVRCGFSADLPNDFPKVDDKFNQLTSGQLNMLFDKMLALPTLNCQGGGKAFFTALKYPYLIHVYLNVDYLGCEEITFELFDNEDIAIDELKKSNRAGYGSADANAIKKTISLIEKNEDPFGFLCDNAIGWESGEDE